MRKAVPRALLLLAVLAACTEPFGTFRDREVVGMIKGFTDQDPRIAITVAGGEITVSVISYGGGCDVIGPTRSTREGRVIEVVPYDYTPVDRRRSCPAVVRTFEHVARIEIDGPGTWTVRVRGRDVGGATVVEERTVLVDS